ncbi:MAG TPA: hypothetical protein VMB35_08300 [Methanomicrobiales archaeon]|nr:hypothetical protein [Methanomicrobiales archaeon]
MAAPPESPTFAEYMKRVAHVIALQGIFGVILLSTRYLPDQSAGIVVQGQVLTLLDVNSLAVFALFLVLTIAVFRQESEVTLGQGDPFLRVLEGYGSPSGSTTLFRVAHAVFSVVMVLVYLTAAPVTPGALLPTLHQELGVVVLLVVVVFSSHSVSAATSRFFDVTMAGFRRAFACLIYLVGLGLIFGGAVTGTQNLLISGMAVIAFEILYVVIREDRRVRSGDSFRDE